MVYKQVSIDLTPQQQRKIAQGKSIQLTAGQVASDKHKIFVHPANYEKIMKAKRKRCGCRINIEHGEINHDLEKLQGGSLWSWLKDKAWPWIKTNILPAVADAVVPAAASFIGAPALAGPVRGAIKDLTNRVRIKIVRITCIN